MWTREATLVFIVAVTMVPSLVEAQCQLMAANSSQTETTEKLTGNITICETKNKTICCMGNITESRNSTQSITYECTTGKSQANCSQNCSCIEICSNDKETCPCLLCDQDLVQNCTSENCSTWDGLNCTRNDTINCTVADNSRCWILSKGMRCNFSHECPLTCSNPVTMINDNATDLRETEGCPDWTFGLNCLDICTCNRSTSDRCDHVNGTCFCSNMYRGKNCTEVIKLHVHQDQDEFDSRAIIIVLFVIFVLLVAIGVCLKCFKDKQKHSDVEAASVFDNPVYDAKSEEVKIDKKRKSTVKNKQKDDVTFIRFSLPDEIEEELAVVGETERTRKPSTQSNEMDEEVKPEEKDENVAVEAAKEINVNQTEELYSTADIEEAYSDQDLYNVVNEKKEAPSSNNIYNTFSEVLKMEKVLSHDEDDYDVVDRETLKVPDCSENYSTFKDVRNTFMAKGWKPPPTRGNEGKIFSFTTDNLSDRSHFKDSNERVKSMISLSYDDSLKRRHAGFSSVKKDMRKTTAGFLSVSNNDMQSNGCAIYDECAEVADVRKTVSESEKLNDGGNAFIAQSVDEAYEENDYDVVDRDLVVNIPADVDEYATFTGVKANEHNKAVSGNDTNDDIEISEETGRELLVISNENSISANKNEESLKSKKKKKKKGKSKKVINSYENVAPVATVVSKKAECTSDTADLSKTEDQEIVRNEAELETPIKQQRLKSKERRKIDYEEFKLPFAQS